MGRRPDGVPGAKKEPKKNRKTLRRGESVGPGEAHCMAGAANGGAPLRPSGQIRDRFLDRPAPAVCGLFPPSWFGSGAAPRQRPQPGIPFPARCAHEVAEHEVAEHEVPRTRGRTNTRSHDLRREASRGPKNMPWECIGNALGMPRECLGNALGMPWNALGMHWECLGNASGIPCFRAPKPQPNPAAEHPRDLPSPYHRGTMSSF